MSDREIAAAKSLYATASIFVVTLTLITVIIYLTNQFSSATLLIGGRYGRTEANPHRSNPILL
jgi:hypothetical protein